MAIKVRDYLENYGYKVDYDNKSGGVLVTDATGKVKNIGNAGLTLGEDGSYYARSADSINSMLGAAGVTAGNGFSGVRNELTKRGNSVGWLDDGVSKQLTVNGRSYNPADGNFINIGGTLYAKNSYIDSLADTGYKSPYAGKIEKKLSDIEGRRFSYDPENDAALEAAQKSAMEKVQQQLNSQGILNSSLNALYTQRAAQELVPEYSDMAYQRFKDEEDADYAYLNALLGLDGENYARYADREQRSYNNQLLTADKEQAAAAARSQQLYDTIERIRTTGFVSNGDSLITGLPAGRVDADVMARIDEFTANTRLAQLDNESYKYKADVDFENSKALMEIEQANEKELLDLKSKYEAYLLGIDQMLESQRAKQEREEKDEEASKSTSTKSKQTKKTEEDKAKEDENGGNKNG